MSLIALVLLAALAVVQCRISQQLAEALRVLDAKSDGMADALKPLSGKVDALQGLAQQANASLDGLADAAASTENDLKSQSSSLTELKSLQHIAMKQMDSATLFMHSARLPSQPDADMLARKVGLVTGIMGSILNAQEEGDRPRDAVAFSDFTSPGWRKMVEIYVRDAASAGVTFPVVDLDGGKDTITFDKAGTYLADGVFLRNTEIYDIFNGEPNLLVVLATGLVGLEDDTLEVQADKDLDKVELDGCLKWKAGKPADGMAVWTAADAVGETRTVRVSKGVPVSVSSSCPMNYFLRENILLMRSLSKGGDRHDDEAPAAVRRLIERRASPSPRTQGAAPASFGGIGAGLSKKHGSLFVASIVAGSPAEAAGLKKGDRITAVDGQSVGPLSTEEAVNRIRGIEGTSVALTCKVYATGKTRKITLTRGTISPSAKPPESRPAQPSPPPPWGARPLPQTRPL